MAGAEEGNKLAGYWGDSWPRQTECPLGPALGGYDGRCGVVVYVPSVCVRRVSVVSKAVAVSLLRLLAVCLHSSVFGDDFEVVIVVRVNTSDRTQNTREAFDNNV